MKDRKFIYDIIRSIAIFFVICIHSLGLVNKAVDEGNVVARWTDACMSIVYSGVPLFVMLSGALLLRKEEPVTVFLNKRLSRILLPFLLWSTIVCTISYWQDGGRSIFECVRRLIIGLCTGGVHGIYWYVYMIIGIYLITPFLRIIINHSESRLVYLLAVLVLLISLVGKWMPQVQLFAKWNSDNIDMLFYYVTGNILVYELQYHRFFVPIVRWSFVFLLVLQVLSRYYHLEIPMLSMALYVSMFGTLLSIPVNEKLPSRFMEGIRSVSRMSYGIYLSHFMLVSAFLKLNYFQELPLCIEPICMASCVLLADMVMLWMLSKIRIGKCIM